MMAAKRLSLFFPVMLLCALAGVLYGPGVKSAAAASSDDDVKTSLKTFTKAYSIVEQNFADIVDPDKAIYNGALPTMLRTLDPHSNFFDPTEFARMREEQRGNYYGVGMRVLGRGSAGPTVHEPFKGSPAWKAGLRPGDLIIAVNETNTRGMTTDRVAELLKGPRGTTVKIQVEREGHSTPFSFNVTRDSIAVLSVPEAIDLKNGVWYIKIIQFDEITNKGLEEDLRRIGEANIKGLILDLRANPGGLVNEGVAVADKFLTKDDVIVSHHGRSSPEKIYTATSGNHGCLYPIVVLVNRNSASAAEIVTGALQDHDRAFVFGENTFGKGLVQSVYPLVENTGLTLTIARYYTPSGRLIQRDYSHTSFFDYYFKQNTEAKNMQDVKMTDGGRTVYGGGGISPDKKFVPERPNNFQIEMLRDDAFYRFTSFYRGKVEPQIASTWTPDDRVVNAFHDYLLSKKIPFTEAEFTQDMDFVKNKLTFEMYWSALSSDDAHAFEHRTDPEVVQAVELLPEAQILLNSSKKLVVQRRTR